MLYTIKPEEVGGWVLIFLLGLVIVWAYNADREQATTGTDRAKRSGIEGWAMLGGILLIGVFCWMLTRDIFGPGALANGSATLLFVVIGANLADESKHAD